MNYINNFDANLLDVGASFLAVACKYAGFFAIVSYVLRKIINAFGGKDRIF